MHLARHLDQQGVARRVTQGIVDDLEPVEVDEENRALPPIAMRSFDRNAQQLVEHRPVWQIGQVVVGGKILDALLRLLFLVGTVEIFQRERNVAGKPLQEFNKLRRERVQLCGHE